jgi:hypothetical protein
MRFSVHFAQRLDAPPEIVARLKEVLLDVAESLGDIPSASKFWGAMDSGNAELNLGRWRFEYRVDARDGRILVLSARELAGARTG